MGWRWTLTDMKYNKMGWKLVANYLYSYKALQVQIWRHNRNIEHEQGGFGEGIDKVVRAAYYQPSLPAQSYKEPSKGHAICADSSQFRLPAQPLEQREQKTV